MQTQIEIVRDGVTIAGVIRERSHAGLTVEMLAPYAGLVGYAPHIPTFARGVNDYRTEYGLEAAERVLADLFAFACDVERNAAELRPLLETFNTMKKELALRDAAIEADLQSLRRKFREGLLDQQEYHRQLKRFVHDHIACHAEWRALFTKLFAPRLNLSVSLDEEQALVWMGCVLAT